MILGIWGFGFRADVLGLGRRVQFIVFRDLRFQDFMNLEFRVVGLRLMV